MWISEVQVESFRLNVIMTQWKRLLISKNQKYMTTINKKKYVKTKNKKKYMTIKNRHKYLQLHHFSTLVK